jgi:SAM-dependent methyltransferase
MTQERARAQEWYTSWFDTPYYHLLYRHRNDNEAAAFIRRLCEYLNLPPKSKALDLACGRGRHARVMAELGLDVIGLDLSKENIREARKSEHKYLHFFEHDMREVWKNRQFDVIFNLFTSFGYFDDPAEDARVISSVASMLKDSGYFVFDYLHAPYVQETFIPRDEKVEDDIHFFISRHITEDWIIKQISFKDQEQEYRFFEKVRHYQPEQLSTLLLKNGFEILRTFGDYELNALENDSPRCIFVARKV